MGTDYYILVGEETQGPFTIEQLEQMLRNGEISAETRVAADGWDEWTTVALLVPTRFVDPPRLQPVSNHAKPMSATKVLGLGCLFSFAILLLVSGIATTCNPGRQIQREESWDAYYTAEQFVKQTYPGADKISAYRDSVVQQDGSDYVVAVMVDGRNAFGGPVRKVVGVVMEKDGGTWRLKRIEQR